jgi:hypothetical protein
MLRLPICARAPAGSDLAEQSQCSAPVRLGRTTPPIRLNGCFGRTKPATSLGGIRSRPQLPRSRHSGPHGEAPALWRNKAKPDLAPVRPDVVPSILAKRNTQKMPSKVRALRVAAVG